MVGLSVKPNFQMAKFTCLDHIVALRSFYEIKCAIVNCKNRFSAF